MTSQRRHARRLIVLFFLLGVLGFFVYNRYPSPESKTMLKPTVFVSQNSAFDFSFEYPSVHWTAAESRGRSEKYDAVYLKGPFDPAKKFRTLIEVVVKPSVTAEAPALLEAFLKRTSVRPKFKVLDRREILLGGAGAASAVYALEERLPMNSSTVQPAEVRGQTVFLTRNGKTYRLALHSLGEGWKDHAAVFQKVLESFKFKD